MQQRRRTTLRPCSVVVFIAYTLAVLCLPINAAASHPRRNAPISQHADKITPSKVFRCYIGASNDVDVKFADVPISSNKELEVHFIISFAIDAVDSFTPKSTNGKFLPYWNNRTITPDAVEAIKAQHENVKVMMAIGGDTIGENQNVEFNPQTASSWLHNALTSLTSLIREYHLDGIDIDYEHFNATTSMFASCIGQLVSELKSSKTISVASIAPFDFVESYYAALWQTYGHVFDYVNFQFYTYDTKSSVQDLVKYYQKAMTLYKGGKVLSSYSTDPDAFTNASSTGITPENTFQAYHHLKSTQDPPGMFMWVADTSASSNFKHEVQAQDMVLAM